MRKIFLVPVLLMACSAAMAQTIQQKLQAAAKHLLSDGQMKHATLGLYVANSKTNAVVYDINGQVGLAPASTQKIFTSIAAMDILGIDYKYKTEISYDGEIKDSTLKGDLFVTGYGDPSFGSWRFNTTKRDTVLKQITAIIKAAGIAVINGTVYLDNSKFSYQPMPGGWMWEDMGNYYGAGTWGINWNENQYDLTLKPGSNEGDSVKIVKTDPVLEIPFINFLTTGKRGSGDNGYIYLPPYGSKAFVEGTEAAGEKEVTISGAMANPGEVLTSELYAAFKQGNIAARDILVMYDSSKQPAHLKTILAAYQSPHMDSLIFWFLQKSINLYGEAFAKTLAYEKTGLGSTERGVDIIRDYWKERGIEKAALKMMDGSGLSPQNRVTAYAEVTALQYAKTRPWFSSFYTALPVYNGTKMKSGTIGGAKAFAGYQTAADGNEYTFSIIINNYDGSTDAVIQKMYALLDVLK